MIDPYNLVISLFFGLIGIYIAYQANLIAKRTLEQNRPKLVFSNIKGGENVICFYLTNLGNFEAKGITVFYKSKNDSRISRYNKSNIILSPESSILFNFKDKEYRSVICVYQNNLTDTVYIVSANILFGNGSYTPLDDSTAIKNEDLEKVLSFASNHSYHEILQYIENISN
jgi:hypothetical protein